MTALCGTPKPWDVSSCLGETQSHSQSTGGHGQLGTRGGVPIQDKWENGRVDATGLAQQNLQDHKQERTDLSWRDIAYRVQLTLGVDTIIQ